VERDEIVRGFEIRKDEFVVVTDEELEGLEPVKSREIDLRRFVPVERIDPALFERPYFLVPSGPSVKPYRLLAQTMERTGKAGIATFVMRTKEYLVAILAQNGILRAETLRYADEIRSAEDIGLPAPAEAEEQAVAAIEQEIRIAARPGLDPAELRDEQSARVLGLAQRKLAEGRDVFRPHESGYPEEEHEQEEQGGGRVIDIMQLLKASLARPSDEPGNDGKDEPLHRSADSQDAGTVDDAGLEGMSRSALYRRAQELDIPGRSAMTREELLEAIRRRTSGQKWLNRLGWPLRSRKGSTVSLLSPTTSAASLHCPVAQDVLDVDHLHELQDHGHQRDGQDEPQEAEQAPEEDLADDAKGRGDVHRAVEDDRHEHVGLHVLDEHVERKHIERQHVRLEEREEDDRDQGDQRPEVGDESQRTGEQGQDQGQRDAEEDEHDVRADRKHAHRDQLSHEPPA
jgi:DNA end-binding protein Ku